MNPKEQELFLRLCHFLSPSKEQIELLLPDSATPHVLGQLFFNRTAAIAYDTLKQMDLLNKVNREFRNSLAAAYQQNLEKNNSFFICLEMLSEILQHCKGKYTMLKGALLCSLYPPGYRTCNDIDLLVRPENVSDIGNALMEAGFKQGHIRNGTFKIASRREIIESKMMRGETVPYILEVDLPYIKFLEVDINFSLDYKNGTTEVINSMLSKTTTYPVGDCEIDVLNKYDFFIHLCSHLYKEATTLPWIQMHRDMTLYKFCDLYFLLNTFTVSDIQDLFYRAQMLGAANVCSCAILWTHALLPIQTSKALETANNFLIGKETMLQEVIDPAEKKVLMYSTADIKARFFSNDRATLLQEINKL